MYILLFDMKKQPLYQLQPVRLMKLYMYLFFRLIYSKDLIIYIQIDQFHLKQLMYLFNHMMKLNQILVMNGMNQYIQIL